MKNELGFDKIHLTNISVTKEFPYDYLLGMPLIKEFSYDILLIMHLIREFPYNYLNREVPHDNINLLPETKHFILQQIVNKPTALSNKQFLCMHLCFTKS